MSLNYDLSKIKDSDTVCWTPDPDRPDKKIMNPVTQALIFGAMAIGIGEITPRTAAEFWQRVAIEEKVNGAWLKQVDDNDNRTDRPLTPADIYAHLGLVTNVFPKTSVTKWRGQVLRSVQQHASKAWDEFLAEQNATSS